MNAIETKQRQIKREMQEQLAKTQQLEKALEEQWGMSVSKIRSILINTPQTDPETEAKVKREVGRILTESQQDGRRMHIPSNRVRI